jgi:hypothetical protein
MGDPYNHKEPFKSDGCSWFPDLWFKECCRTHDYGVWAGYPEHENDCQFLYCIANRSRHLKAFSFLFAGLIVTGMALGRPVRKFWLSLKKRCGTIKGMKEPMQQMIESHETQVAAAKAAPAIGGGILTALTLNEWVALATLIYVVLQIGLLIPRYVEIYRRWKKKKQDQ